MTGYLTEDEIVDAVPGLTHTRLVTFIETQMIVPLHPDNPDAPARLFRRVDCARVQLLCELTDDLGLDESALGVVIALIDKLHATQRDLLAMTRAVDDEPKEIRQRIGAAILRQR